MISNSQCNQIYEEKLYSPETNISKEIEYFFKGNDRHTQLYRRKHLLQTMLQAVTFDKAKIMSGHTDKIIYIEPHPQNNFSQMQRGVKLYSFYSKQCGLLGEADNIRKKIINQKIQPECKHLNNHEQQSKLLEQKDKINTMEALNLYYNQRMQILPQIKTMGSQEKITIPIRYRQRSIVAVSKEYYPAISIETLLPKYSDRKTKTKTSPRVMNMKLPKARKDSSRKRKSQLSNQIIDQFNPQNVVYKEDNYDEDDFYNYVSHRSKHGIHLRHQLKP